MSTQCATKFIKSLSNFDNDFCDFSHINTNLFPSKFRRTGQLKLYRCRICKRGHLKKKLKSGLCQKKEVMKNKK
jgi:hypothetical protein